eukprot:GEMP01000625.1.p1 GENE.GEMP01000625.1~~GEMP01000625.1.p1  ORF type:complete len:1823 (+),score=417.36 GEMP01000625.1:100-5568(+)
MAVAAKAKAKGKPKAKASNAKAPSTIPGRAVRGVVSLAAARVPREVNAPAARIVAPPAVMRTVSSATLGPAVAPLSLTPTGSLNGRPLGKCAQRGPMEFFYKVQSEPYEQLMLTLRNQAGKWDFHLAFDTPAYKIKNQNVIFSCVSRLPALGHHVDLLKFFHEEHNVSIDLQDSLLQNALFYACTNGLHECAAYLLSQFKVLNINDRDKMGETALFYCARTNHPATAKILVRYKADLEVKGSKNTTALMEAVMSISSLNGKSTNPSMVKFLLEQKANVDMPAGSVTSPLMQAVKRVCFDLDNRTVPHNPPVALLKDYSVIKALLAAAADPNWRNSSGETALFIAVRAKHVDLVRELIVNHNADGLVRSNAGQSLICLCEFDTPMGDLLSECQAGGKVVKKRRRAGVLAEDIPLWDPISPTPSPAKPASGATGKRRIMDLEASAADENDDDPIKEVKQEKMQPTAFKVVQSGTLGEIMHLFEVGNEDHDQMNSLGENVVHAAAKRKSGALEVCKYLVEKLGTFAMFCDHDFSRTPLFHAVTYGNDDCIEFLVQKNCDPNSVDAKNMHIMIHAVKAGSVKACQILHSLGATLDLKTDGEANLAHLAAENGFDEILEFLLENKVPASEQNARGFTPLHLAKNRYTAQTLLNHGVQLLELDKEGVAPVFSHIRFDHVDTVRFLLEQKCGPEMTDKDGKTPLVVAIEEDRPEVVRVLIDDFKISLTTTDKEGRTPDALAVSLGRTMIYDALKTESLWRLQIAAKQEGNDLQLRSSVGGSSPLQQIKTWIVKYECNPKRLWTPGKMDTLLFLAASRPTADVLEVVKYLIDECGLEAGFVDLQGETALFTAVTVNKESNFAVAQLLLERKCDPHQASIKGLTALFEAVASNNMRCVDLLLEHKVDVNHRNVARENVLFGARTPEMLERLLAAGADATLVNVKGRSCIFENVNADMVTKLIANKCPVDCVDANRQTCLFAAVKSKPVTDILLENGVDVRQVSATGRTCLHNAVDQQSEEVARMLVEAHKLDPFLLDDNDCSPLMIAENKKLKAFVQFVHEQQESIKEEQERKNQAAKELNILLWENKTLDDAKAFIEERGPSFEWRTHDMGQTSIFSATYSYQSLRCDDDAVQIVEYLIELKVDPTVRDRNNQSALFYACRYAGPQTCRLLIESQCNVNDTDMQGSTPLSYATQSLKPEKMVVVNMLLDEKADPNVSGKTMSTELFRAADVNDIDMVRTLVHRGSNLEQKNPKFGRTALFAAAALLTTEAMGILLRAGANANAADDLGQTALFVCSPGSVSLLIDAKADPNHKTLLDENALFAVSTVQKLEALVKAKCNVDHRDAKGKTCLFVAMESGHIDICERLIHDYQVDPNHGDSQGRTCVSVARGRGDRQEFLGIVEALQRRQTDLERILLKGTLVELERLAEPGELTYTDSKTGQHYGFIVAGRDPMLPDTVEMFKKLEQAEIDLQQRDQLGRTCFFVAAQTGNITAMQYLLTAQCNVNDADNEQQTPLFVAVRGGDITSFQFLIDNHADKDAVSDVLGESLLFPAIRSGKQDMVKAVLDISKHLEFDLTRENHEGVTPLLEAVRQDDSAILKLVLESGAKVNAKAGGDQKSALFCCISTTACITLLAFQADVSVTDKSGRTPLFGAVARRNPGSVDALVANNAQVNALDNCGRSPIFLCVEEEGQDMSAMLQKLVDLGADTNVTDREGQTPTSIAKANKNRKNSAAYVSIMKKKTANNVRVNREYLEEDPEPNWAVRLIPQQRLDGSLDQCKVTFYDPENPDCTVPRESEKYRTFWRELKRLNPELLGALAYPANAPWTEGTT